MGRAKKTNRGSPEAIAKRKAARALNRIFDGTPGANPMDGRTLKRKKRLVDELVKGRQGKPLKALEVLGHVTELLGLGETLTTIRKMKPQIPPSPPTNADNLEIIKATQNTYQFDPKAWKILGVDIDSVERGETTKPVRKRATKKAAKRAAGRKA